MQRRGSYRRCDLLETARQVPVQQKRSKTIAEKISAVIPNAVTSLFSSPKGSSIVGRTPKHVIIALGQELKFEYLGQDKDQYAQVQKFARSSEEEILLMKSATTGQLYVMKHTFASPPQMPTMDQEPSPLDSFPNEAVILAQKLYPHPNIVSIFETFPDRMEPGRHRMWMEYCSGGNLFDQYDFWYNKRRSVVPEVFLLHIIVELMEALAYLHSGLRYSGGGRYTIDRNPHAIAHGDVKEENVFLRWPDIPIGGLPNVVFGDFGIAKLAADRDKQLLPGTLPWRSPELKAIYGDKAFNLDTRSIFVEVGEQRTAAADIYALGQLVSMFAEKERKPGRIGRDPNTVQVSRDYDTPGIRDFIVRCLAVDPAE